MLVEEAGEGSRRSRGVAGVFRVLRVAAGLEGGCRGWWREGCVWRIGGIVDGLEGGWNAVGPHAQLLTGLFRRALFPQQAATTQALLSACTGYFRRALLPLIRRGLSFAAPRRILKMIPARMTLTGGGTP